MKRWTAKQIHNLHPCGWDEENDGENYTLARIRAIGGRRKTIRIVDVPDLDIPAGDKAWLMLHMLVVESPNAARAVTERIVRRAVRYHCLGCGVVEAERWARAWLRGAKWARTEAAAWGVAMAAAAAGAPAWAAAMAAAAKDVAWATAARDAARAAAVARAGAGVATLRAAADEEYKRQITDVLAVVGGKG